MTNLSRRRKEVFPVKIISNREISPQVYILEIEKKIDFKAGQVIGAALQPDHDLRLYSIASGTQETTLKILFDVVLEGELTPHMAQMKSGDTLYMSEPFGRFTNSPNGSWWIATGTGIAPFAAMAQSGKVEGITLLQGARQLNQFYFSDLFKEKMGKRYLRFCTSESHPDVHSGRLTTFLKESNDLIPTRKYYLCGNSNMVVEVRDLLLSKGVPFEQIIAEIYF